MKIIEHGDKSEPKIFRFKCPRCGCVFEEYEKSCSSVAINDVKMWLSVECPECGEECCRIDLSGEICV